MTAASSWDRKCNASWERLAQPQASRQITGAMIATCAIVCLFGEVVRENERGGMRGKRERGGESEKQKVWGPVKEGGGGGNRQTNR